MQTTSIFRDAMTDTAALIAEMAGRAELHDALERVAVLTADAIRAGGTLFICGNGGSAAQATHFAGELIGPFHDRARRAYAAVPLGFDPASLTACANDFSYEHAMARQLEGLGRPGDVVWGLSTSGNSPNILAVFAQAKKMGLRTVLFANQTGGRAAAMVDERLLVPSTATPRVQEGHLIFGHGLCEAIEKRLGTSPDR